MKNFLILIFLGPVLLACNGTTSSNLRPQTTTHDAVYANINLSAEYMREGNYEGALERLERARRIDPGYYGTYNMLGMLYQQLGEMNLAENSFKRALSLNSNDPPTLNNYGQFLCSANDREKARELFLKAANNPLYETPEVAYYNAGKCAMLSENPADAERFFRKALELNPTMPESLIVMSEMSMKRGNYLSARGYLQRYLSVASHTPKSLWLGIQIERELGDEDTVSSYALLLRNNYPDSREAAMLRETGLR